MRTTGPAIALFVVACVTAASAQPSPDPATPVTPAMALFAEGRELLVAKRFAEACAKFEAAVKLEPDDMGPLLNLGLCNEGLDHLATALKWLRRAQARASELGKHDTELAAKAKAVTLASRVPTLRLDVAHPPTNLGVAIDGTVVEAVDITRLELDAGHHVIELTLEGAPSERAEVDLRDGDARTLTMATPRVPVKRLVVVDRGHARRKQAYIVGAVGGGLLVGDLALGLIGKHEYDAAERPSTQEHWREAVLYGSTSMFVLGTAALVGAVWMYAKAPPAERVEQIVVAPVVAPGRVGVAITTAF